MRRRGQPALDGLRILVRSIRFRLALWFAAVLAAVLVGFSAFIYARQARDLNDEAQYKLNARARQLEAYLKYNAGEYFVGKRQLTPVWGEERQYWLQEDDILALADLDGNILQKVGPVAEADLKQVAQIGIAQGIYENRFSYSVVEATAEGKLIEEKYLFVVAPVSDRGGAIGSLILGGPVDPNGQLRRLLVTLTFGNLATLGLALAGGYWLAHRAMRPVRRIVHTAREISATDLSRRIGLNTQDELGELASTFDRMLDRLKEAFDRQRQFTADASHELRTPLTIINLEVNHALAARRSEKEYRCALGVVQAENERMTHLVNNLLALSRMDAGQIELAREPLDLSDVTLEVVERLSPLAQGAGVQLFTGSLPELLVRGDRQFLGQMISNLVENAIKYTRGEAPRVVVETELDGRLPGGGQAAVLRVRDNGPGIAPEHLGRIFDRFYQLDPARAHSPEEAEGGEAAGAVSTGSGLGLSIVQWIARAHGGEARAASEVGRGSEFSVWLPLATPENRFPYLSDTGGKIGF